MNMKVGKEKGFVKSLIVTPPCVENNTPPLYVYGWSTADLSSQFSFSPCVIPDNGYPRI